MPRRTFQELLALGRPALGTWSQMASAEAIDMIGAAGFDYTIIDCEHGFFGLETAEGLIRACDANGLVPLVRAPKADATWVSRALDAGAEAVVVPGIASAAMAAEMVRASRYAPEGTRSACPCIRAGQHYVRDWRAHETSERRKGVLALVETRDGLANVEAICATPGLLGLVAGPFDLAVSLGHHGDYLYAEVQAGLDRMLAAARRQELPVIAPVFTPDREEGRRQRARWQERGATMLVVATDKILFSEAARHAVETFRG